MKKAVIFDVNGTLVHENTWMDLNLAMGVRPEEDEMLMSWGEQNIISDQQGQDILCSIYKLRGNPTLEKIVETVSAYTFYSGVKKTIKALRERGYEIGIISGAMDIFVQIVATDLSIEHWRSANRFIFDSDDRLDSIVAPDSSDGAEKVALLKDLALEIGVDLKHCFVVGDGSNDSEIFKITGNGITFTGSSIAHLARYSVRSLPDVLKVL